MRCAFTLLSVLHLHVLGFRLESSTRLVHIEVNTTATIMCKALDSSNRPVPLSRCQFDVHLSKTIDLSAGAGTPHHPGYQYSGSGLQNGECGVVLGGFNKNDVFYRNCGCRARDVNGGQWQYADFIIVVNSYQDMPFNLQTSQEVVLEGSNITIAGVADRPISNCIFYLPNIHYGLNFKEGSNSSTATGGHRYFGSGLRNKECGITLVNVSDSLNGWIIGYVGHANEGSHSFTTLIVASAPEKPRLNLTNPGVYKPGDILEATCVIVDGSPVSNITWLLDDVVLREDTIDESPVDDAITSWRWSFEPQTITQHLKRTLSMADDGKQLTCRSGHIALPTGTESTSIHIIVKNGWPGIWVIPLLVILLLVAVSVAIYFIFFRRKCGAAKFRLNCPLFGRRDANSQQDIGFQVDHNRPRAFPMSNNPIGINELNEEGEDGYLTPIPPNPKDLLQPEVEEYYTDIPDYVKQAGISRGTSKPEGIYDEIMEPEEVYDDIMNVQPPRKIYGHRGNQDNYMNVNDESSGVEAYMNVNLPRHPGLSQKGNIHVKRNVRPQSDSNPEEGFYENKNFQRSKNPQKQEDNKDIYVNVNKASVEMYSNTTPTPKSRGKK